MKHIEAFTLAGVKHGNVATEVLIAKHPHPSVHLKRIVEGDAALVVFCLPPRSKLRTGASEDILVHGFRER